jgi:hypothetical protein
MKRYGQCPQCQVKQFESFYQGVSRLMASFFLKEYWWQVLSGHFIKVIKLSVVLGYIDESDGCPTKLVE